MKHSLRVKTRKILAYFVLTFIVILIVAPVATYPQEAKAFLGIGDVDFSTIIASPFELAWDAIKLTIQTAGDVMFRNALSTFASKIAYDTAVWIGSGAKGQEPMFIQQPGRYLLDAADAAAGDFLDQLSTVAWGQSLCDMDPLIKYEIYATVKSQYGLEDYSPYYGGGGIYGPGQQSRCLASEIWNNGLVGFDVIVKMEEIKKVQWNDMFEMDKTSLGQLITIGVEVGEYAKEGEEEAEGEASFGSSLLPSMTFSGIVKTPSFALEDMQERALALSSASEETHTGNIIADAIGLFLNTLIKTWINTLFYEGLNPNVQEGIGRSGSRGGGILAAREKFYSLSTPQFSSGAEIDTLSQLVACPDDPDYRATNNCIIDNQFSSAVQQKMRVGDAVEAGLLDGNKIFGFDSMGQQPDFRSGYPYNSMVVLRKYRILPVGWEIAAQYIRDVEDPRQTHSLNDMLEAYDDCGLCSEASTNTNQLCDEDADCPDGTCSQFQCVDGVNQGNVCENDADCLNSSCQSADFPLCHLVDPAWVLKAPSNYCRRQGPGEQIISEDWARIDDTNDDFKVDEKDDPIRMVIRQDYCADEQTCIIEKDDGSCDQYGYCVEEKEIWKIDGKGCSDDYNSCLAFSGPEGQVAYMTDTIDYDSCNAENAGCQWYCEDYDSENATFQCDNYPINPRSKDGPDGREGTDDDQYMMCDDPDGCACVNDIGDSCIVAEGEYNCESNCQLDYQCQLTGGCLCVSWSGLSCTALADGPDGIAETTDDNSCQLLTSPECHLDNSKQYLDNSVASCKASEDGCHEYIRVTEGTNLLSNSSFELFDGSAADNDPDNYENYSWEKGSVAFDTYARSNPYDGNYAVMLTEGGVVGALSNYFNTEADIENRSFTFSYYAKANKEGCSGGFGIDGNVAGGGGSTANYITDWQRYAYTHIFTGAGGETTIQPFVQTPVGIPPGTGCEILVDAAQLEVGVGLTEYKNYGTTNFLYLDKERNACLAEEMNCNLYTPRRGGLSVPAKITEPGSCSPSDIDCDQCDQDQVGCRTFRELALEGPYPLPSEGWREFSNPNFLMDSGDRCSAGYVGCEEYTNLDTIALGGEGREYYTSLRLCALPENTGCNTYYTWEGSEETGYQIKIHNMIQDVETGGPCVDVNFDPATYDPDNITCQAGTGSQECTYGDDPDCREYFDENGNEFYRSEPATITCSDDCHPLRNTMDQIIYPAIPSQNESCPSNYAGCREYRGATGSNYRFVIDHDFEQGNIGEWSDGTLSAESITAGGHSMQIDGATTHPVDVNQGMTYILSFWAKGSGSIGATMAGQNFSQISDPDILLSGDWRSYTIGPLAYEGVPSGAETIEITGTGFIDNIVLKENPSSLYLVKDSWTACDQVGCDEYYDLAKDTHYLKSFNKLCREEAIGCEAMIDTNNSTNPFAEFYPYEETHFIGSRDEVKVEEDFVRFIVNNKNDYCQAANKGCTKFGDPNMQADNSVKDFQSVYLIDDPNSYDDILCREKEVGCQTFTSPDYEANYYFKDPGQRVCEYKEGANVEGLIMDGWFIKGTNAACHSYELTSGEVINIYDTQDDDFNNDYLPGDTTDLCQYRIMGECSNDPHQVCAADDECGADDICLDLTKRWCLKDSPDEECYPCFTKLCPDKQSTCTEYRDPSFRDPDKPDLACEIHCPVQYDSNGVILVDEDCLSDTTEFPSIVADQPGCQSYYYLSNSVDKSYCNGAVDQDNNCLAFAEMRDLNLNINPQESLTPYAPGACSACSIDRQGVDANQTPAEMCTTEDNCCAVEDEACQANTILKVIPDRACNEWLYCQVGWTVSMPSGEQEKMCFQLGACDRMDSNGECISPVSVGACSLDGAGCTHDYECPGEVVPGEDNVCLIEDLVVASPADVEMIKNRSGLVVAGATWEGGTLTVPGYYPYAGMRQVGLGIDLVNGDLESVGKYPWIERVEGAGSSEIHLEVTASNNSLKVVANGLNSGVKSSLNGWVNEGDTVIVSFKARSDVVLNLDVKLGFANDTNLQTVETFSLNSNWQYYTAGPYKVTLVPTGTTYLDFVLQAGDSGTFWLDDVSLNSLLEKKSWDSTWDPQLVDRTCRMYPRNDSLECTYFDRSGAKEYRGWKGYCVEKDPRNPNLCLQWWPVDVIQGESDVFGTETMAGYVDRTPLYICAQMGLYEFRRTYYRRQDTCHYCETKCPAGYSRFYKDDENLRLSGDDDYDCRCCNECSEGFFTMGDRKEVWCRPKGGAGWVGYTGGLVRDALRDQVEILGKRCDVVAMVVDAQGRSHVWAQRIKSESGHQVEPDLLYSYAADLAPYGGVVPPYNVEHLPEVWDSDWTFPNIPDLNYSGTTQLSALQGKEPLYVINEDDSITWNTLARAGSPYCCYDSIHCEEQGNYTSNETLFSVGGGTDRAKRLFAGPLNAWIWNEPRCEVIEEEYYCSEDVLHPIITGKECNEDDGVCEYEDGQCSSRICLGTDGPIYTEEWGEERMVEGKSCGCPSGSGYCETLQLCATPDPADPNAPLASCGDTACGESDFCVDSMCVGDDLDETFATVYNCNPVNNCPESAFCSTDRSCQQIDPVGDQCQCLGGDCVEDTTLYCNNDPNISDPVDPSIATMTCEQGEGFRDCTDTDGDGTPGDGGLLGGICIHDATINCNEHADCGYCSPESDNDGDPCTVHAVCTNGTCLADTCQNWCDGTYSNTTAACSGTGVSCETTGPVCNEGWTCSEIGTENKCIKDNITCECPVAVGASGPEATCQTTYGSGDEERDNFCLLDETHPSCECWDGIASCQSQDRCSVPEVDPWGEETYLECDSGADLCNDAGGDCYEGVCQDGPNTGDGCYVNSDCGVGYTCAPHICVVHEDDYYVDEFTDLNYGGVRYKQTCPASSPLPNSGDCLGSTSVCETWDGICYKGDQDLIGATCRDEDDCGSDGACNSEEKFCASGFEKVCTLTGSPCGSDNECSRCVGGVNDGEFCESSAVCAGAVCENGGTCEEVLFNSCGDDVDCGTKNAGRCAGTCSNNSSSCSSFNDCEYRVWNWNVWPPDFGTWYVRHGDCNNKHCIGGHKDGEGCTSNLSCISDIDPDTGPHYEENYFTLNRWAEEFANMAECPGERPPYIGAHSNQDYCFIRPRVSNIKVNGRANKVLIKGSGMAYMTFNSYVDPEQIPLKRIEIFWGNTFRTDRAFNPGVAPRMDPQDPHAYWSLYSFTNEGISQGYRPRVIITDNWEATSDSENDPTASNWLGFFYPGICVVAPDGNESHCPRWWLAI